MSRRRPQIALALGLAALALALATTGRAEGPAASPAPPRVALLPLQPLGASADSVRSLDAVLRAEVGRLGGIKLLTAAQTAAAARAARADIEGCRSVECLSRAGQVSDADWVVFGTVGSLGQSHLLDLKLVDVAGQTEARRLTVKLAGERDVLIEGVRSAVAELIAPDQFVGALEVELAEAGAEVFLDGRSVGKTPLGRIEGLAPGEHALKIALPGYEDFDRFFTVRFGRTAYVRASLTGSGIDADIDADKVAYIERMREHGQLMRGLSLGGMVGGLAVLLVGGGGLWALGELRASDYRTQVADYNAQLPRLQSTHDRLQAMGQEMIVYDLLTVAAVGSGLALAIAGAALWFAGDDPAQYEVVSRAAD
ncbi:MAG: PEGA domain-containing protein [Deltaproteobacteria bacterium]|nr:PEGA domain-containing protein [Deltaproteobacteria bacterium]